MEQHLVMDDTGLAAQVHRLFDRESDMPFLTGTYVEYGGWRAYVCDFFSFETVAIQDGDGLGGLTTLLVHEKANGKWTTCVSPGSWMMKVSSLRGHNMLNVNRKKPSPVVEEPVAETVVEPEPEPVVIEPEVFVRRSDESLAAFNRRKKGLPPARKYVRSGKWNGYEAAMLARRAAKKEAQK